MSKRLIPHDGSYTREIEIDFHCIVDKCKAHHFFEESDDWDINEDIICDCGSEYSVFGDINDGTMRVYLTKETELEYSEEECDFIRPPEPPKPAPNQIDIFYGKTYNELKAEGLVS